MQRHRLERLKSRITSKPKQEYAKEALKGCRQKILPYLEHNPTKFRNNARVDKTSLSMVTKYSYSRSHMSTTLFPKNCYLINCLHCALAASSRVHICESIRPAWKALRLEPGKLFAVLRFPIIPFRCIPLFNKRRSKSHNCWSRDFAPCPSTVCQPNLHICSIFSLHSWPMKTFFGAV